MLLLWAAATETSVLILSRIAATDAPFLRSAEVTEFEPSANCAGSTARLSESSESLGRSVLDPFLRECYYSNSISS